MMKQNLRKLILTRMTVRQFNKLDSPNAVPAIKTKEQLKVEALMEKLPLQVLSPGNDVFLKLKKDEIESLYKYHQGDKKSLMIWDVPTDILEDVNKSSFASSSDQITDFFIKFEGYVPDEYFLKSFMKITLHHPDITEDFYNVILPKLKKMMLNADRNNIHTIAVGAIGCARNNISDTELWEIVHFKLVNERLYRYLSLNEAAYVAYYMTVSRKGSKVLLGLLEKMFIKHRKGISLMKGVPELLTFAYKLNGWGSELLYQALSDPSIEIEGMDDLVKSPKMDKADRLYGATYIQDSHKELH